MSAADTEIGALIRDALSQVGSVYISRPDPSRRYAAKYSVMLTNSQRNEKQGATLTASVSAHGEGETLAEALRDALSKLVSPVVDARRVLPSTSSTIGERRLADVLPKKAISGR